MRKRWRLTLALALTVVVLAVIGHIIYSQWLPAEPVVQGQPLNFWLPHVIMENPGGVHYNHDHYREAVASVGPLAVPFILAKLRKNDSPLADRYRHLRPRLPGLLQRFLPQSKAPDYFSQDAAAGLRCLGPEAIPSLVDAVDDSNPAVRRAAAQALCGFAGGPLVASETARVFGRAIKDADPGVRVFAAFALARIGPAASNSVPALIRALSSSQNTREPGKFFFAQAGAAQALAAIGPPAAAAIPVLNKLLASADHDTQCAFTNAVRALESQLADEEKKPLVPVAADLPAAPSGKLMLWLKADAGVVTNSFGRVHQWQDQSENQNNAVQSCASLEPLLVFPPALGGRPALRFDGLPVSFKPSYGAGHCAAIGPYLKGSGQVDVPGAMTSFCVHLLAAPSSLELTLWAVGEANPATYGQCRGDMISDDLMRFTTWAYDYGAPSAVPPGSWRIRADRLPVGLAYLEMFDTAVEGTAKFAIRISGAQTPRPGYFIGGFDPDETLGRNFNGDIAEVLIYQGALDDADMQAVTDYLRVKYFPGAKAAP